MMAATRSLETEEATEAPVAPVPAPAAVERAVAARPEPQRAVALARLLGALADGARLADWALLAAAYADATERALDEAMRAIVEQVLDLPKARRRQVDAQIDALSRVPGAAAIAARLTTRLAVVPSARDSPPPPSPAPDD